MSEEEEAEADAEAEAEAEAEEPLLLPRDDSSSAVGEAPTTVLVVVGVARA